MVYFDIFMRACEEKGVAPTSVLVDLGISKSAYTNWKSGGEPTNRTKKSIAEYFGVSVKDFLNGEIKKPATGEGDELSEAEEDFLKVWRLVPKEKQEMLQSMIIADLKSKGLL